VITLNLKSALDRLFGESVISADDMDELHNITDTKEQSRKLMVKLHNSCHQNRFIKLRLAIEEEPAYDWFIKKLDDLQLAKPGDQTTHATGSAVTTFQSSDTESETNVTSSPGL
jgi:hypothetical protein